MYSFENNDDILQSFTDVFNKYDLNYTPHIQTSSVSSRYLLRKLQSSNKVPINLHNFFENNLRNKRKLNLRFRKYNDELALNNNIPQEEDDENTNIPTVQQGGNLNNIKIDENALNKNILKIRYLNGRKLNNPLLKHDYKISKQMKNSIKFNKDIHKLTNNEKIIYYELDKYINKDKSLDVLIGSHLSGNNNKRLFIELIKYYMINIKVI